MPVGAVYGVYSILRLVVPGHWLATGPVLFAKIRGKQMLIKDDVGAHVPLRKRRHFDNIMLASVLKLYCESKVGTKSDAAVTISWLPILSHRYYELDPVSKDETI